MNTPDSQVRAIIVQEAAQWHLLNRTGSLSEGQRILFVQWLRTSPMHVQEYLGIATIAQELAAATAGLEAESTLSCGEETKEDHNVFDFPARENTANDPADGRSMFRRVAVAACSTALVVAALLAWTLHPWNSTKTYRTAHGEQSIWPLADGSVLQLNSDSQVTVRYSTGERLVELARGQARFQVAHETGRRFRVVSGITQVIAVGTNFDVYHRTDATVVTVIEGRVAILAGSAPPPSSAASLPTSALSVGAGEQVQVDAAAQVHPTVRAQLSQATAWMRQQIVFDHKKLSEVAEEFNRYGPVPIHIDDERLGELQVSGVFDAYDTESFTSFLKRLDGVAVETMRYQIRVYSLHGTTAGTN